MKQLLNTSSKPIAKVSYALSGVVIAKNDTSIIVRSAEGSLNEIIVDKKHLISFKEKDDVVFNTEGVLVEQKRDITEQKSSPMKTGSTFCKNI